MARQISETITDDLDGSSNASAVSFTYNGVEYSIDLSNKNKTAFDKIMKPYLGAATKVGSRRAGRRTTRATGAKRNDLNAIREWAAANAHEISTRGRIKSEIIAAYDAAHGLN